MVKAWYMDNAPDDQRLPHRPEGAPDLSLELLASLGVLYWKIDVDRCDEEGLLAKIKKDRGYTYQDIVEVCPEKLPNYAQKIKTFFEEHLHTDEEIRLVQEGSGYFDVRDHQDRWVRIEVVKGDLIVLPAGIYHRFTLDSKNYIKALRLFVGEPVWTPINRPADDHPKRVQYLEAFIVKATA
ncbi:hypothetical protein EMCRGX_G014943 [Ephydatia muelleri]